MIIVNQTSATYAMVLQYINQKNIKWCNISIELGYQFQSPTQFNYATEIVN